MMPGVAGPLAEATADIRLSDGRFNTDLATILSRLRTAIATMEAQAKIDLTATVKVDTSQATAQVQKFRDESTALGQINVQLDAQTEQLALAREELVNLQTLAASISDTRITVDASLRDEEAIASATRLQDILTALGSETPIVAVGVNAAEAVASVEALTVELDKLDTKRVDVNVSASGLAQTGAEIEAVDAKAAAAASESGGFGRLATRLGFLAVGGVAAIGALGVKITQLGVNSASSIESTVKSFENILGSASQAHDLFSQLQQFSIPAPFDTIVLANTAKQLLAIGDNVKQVVPDVKTLASAVALLGNQDPAAFEKLTLALGQIGSSVHVNLQDIRQISQALPGFNAQQQLAAGVAAKLGISVQDAAKAISDGSVQGADAMRILIEQMKNFPGASTAIASAADTLKGKLSAFKDTVKLDLIGSFAGVTGQLKDALLPLSDSVDVAFKAIGPQLSSALSNLIPAVGPFVAQLGQALAPAFGGLFTGLGGVLQGLTPALSAALPVVGELAKSLGDLAAAVGPGVAQTATVLGDILVPALQSLATVVDALGPAIGPLITGFLAFKAFGAISGVFDNLAVSVGKAQTKFTEFGSNLTGVSTAAEGTKTAMTGLQTAAGVAAASVTGFLSGIATQSDNTATAITGLVGSAGSITAAFATGGPLGGALAAGATGLGVIVGEFEKGERQAKLFQAAVTDLGRTIKTELALKPGDTVNLAELVNTEGFANTIQAGLGKISPTFQKDLFDKLGIGTEQIQAALSGSDEAFTAFIDKINAAIPTTNVAGKSLATFLFGGLREEAHRTLDQTQAELDANVTAAQRYQTALAKVNEEWDHTGPAKGFADAVAVTGQSFQQVATILPVGAAELDAMSAAFLDATPSLASFAAGLDLTGTALRNALLDEEVTRIKNAADDVKNTFADLGSALSQSISNQNLQAQLSGLSDSLNQVIGADKFAAAKQRAESINSQIRDQQDRIAELKANLADAQAKALQDAADLDVRIADAQAHGSVTGLAALEAAKANVGKDAAKAQRELDKAQRTIGDLQDQLAGLDLTTPQKLIDIVKGQARTAGVDLWTFLLQGPTAEARQLYQQDLAGVVNSAFSNIQKADETQGPQAAIDLLGSIQSKLHDQLVAGGLSPGTADEIVQNMLHPAELTASLTAELNANLEAATKAATLAGHTVDVGLNSASIEKALTDLRDLLAKQPPLPVSVTLTPTSIAPDFADLDKQLFLHPTFDFADLDKQLFLHPASLTASTTLDFADADRQLSLHQAALGVQVAPDFTDADQQMATHGAPLDAVVTPDFADADKQIAVHSAVIPATVKPNTALLDMIFTQPHTINVSVVPDFADLDKQMFLRGAIPAVQAADGGIVEFFRQGGFSRGLAPMLAPLFGKRDLPHIAQIAPAGAWRVFAEPETGGEGYVPLALSKRGRSTEIVRTIADMFGFRLEPKIDVNPTIDIFPAVSPVVNVYPEVTVGPSIDVRNLISGPTWSSGSMSPDRAGRDSSIVQTLTHALASFGQPVPVLASQMRSENRYLPWSGQVPFGHVGMYLTLPHASVASLSTLVGGPASQVASHASYGTAQATIRNGWGETDHYIVPAASTVIVSPTGASFVQSLVAPLSPSRPAVTSVAHMTGWTTVPPSPSMLRLVTIDPKIPAWPATSAAVSSLSVPSIFEHDKRSALPSPFVSQLVVPWPVPWEAPPPRATGGPAQPSTMSSLFDPKTIIAPGAPSGFTSIVDRTAPISIFHPASPQAAGTFMFHSAGPNVTAVPSQVTALFGTQLPYVAPLLPPNMQVQVTPHADLAAAIRELTQMLRSGSPHSERLARAESIARHIHVEAGAITLTSEKPRQSARELVDELTRMAY